MKSENNGENNGENNMAYRRNGKSAKYQHRNGGEKPIMAARIMAKMA